MSGGCRQNGTQSIFQRQVSRTAAGVFFSACLRVCTSGPWGRLVRLRGFPGEVDCDRQQHLLYLGEINSTQELAWRKSIEVLDETHQAPRTLALFPDERYAAVVDDATVVRLRLAQPRLRRLRQWGGCWLALQLWRQLELVEFWAARLPPLRMGTR